MLKCPSCSNEIDKNSFVRKHLSKRLGVEYKLYHCSKCDLQFWAPLEFISKVYTEDILNIGYEISHKVSHLKINDYHRFFITKFSSYIRQTFPNCKILDVGCGNGAFLYHLTKTGFEAYGTDIDTNSINIAKNFFGLKDVFNLSLEDFADYSKKNNLKFDVVTIFEVLEHQVTPSEFIKQIKEILSEDGIIAGSVPNRNRFLANITRLGEGDFPPHHFLWFSPKSLENLFKENSFEPIIIKHLKGDVSLLLSNLSFLIKSLFYQLKTNNPNIGFFEKLKHTLWFSFRHLMLSLYIFVFGFDVFFAFKRKND
ncbi:MAG: class I SAM-dependent methyltransferase [Brevinematia bacterium]